MYITLQRDGDADQTQNLTLDQPEGFHRKLSSY